MHQRRTLRKMLPETRKLANACNDIERSLNTIKRTLPTFQTFERGWVAEANRQAYQASLTASGDVPADGLAALEAQAVNRSFPESVRLHAVTREIDWPPQ